MSRIIPFWIIALASVVSSCSSIYLDAVQVEQLMPAVLSIPQDIKRVGVVDRLCLKQADQPDNLLAFDSGIFTELLGVQLSHADYFEDVLVCDSNLSQMDRQEFKIYPLSQEHVQQLSDGLGVDMLVSVESIQARLLPSYVIPTAQVRAVAKVYLPSRSGVLRTIHVSDTLSWNEGAYMDLSVASVRNDAMNYTCEKIAQQLAPYWAPVQRVYYKGGPVEMRDGALFAEQGNWEKAQATWQQLQTTAKGKTLWMVQFNLALAQEMMGDTQAAINACSALRRLTSPGQVYTQVLSDYLQVLRQRQEKVHTLQLQMQRFDKK